MSFWSNHTFNLTAGDSTVAPGFARTASARMLVYWLPLLAAAVYWYIGIALIDNGRDQNTMVSLLERVEQLKGPSDQSDRSVDAADGRIDDSAQADESVGHARRLLVDLRVLLPELALVAPSGFAELAHDVNKLQAALGAGHEGVAQSAAQNAGTVQKVAAVKRDLAVVQQDLFERSSRQRSRTSLLEYSLIALLVGCTLIGIVVAGSSVRQRQRAPAIRGKPDDPEIAAAPVVGSGLETDRLLFDHGPCAVVVTDRSDVVVRVNAAYLRMTGCEEAEVVGQPLTFNHSGQHDERFYLGMHHSLDETARWTGEFWLRNKSGEAFADKVTRWRMDDQAGDVCGYLTVSTEVVGTDDARRLMLWQAHHDTLTKLPNRNLLQERLTRVLMRTLEPNFFAAVLSIDLDRFKIVNDSEGPAKGDQILMEAASRIAMCAHESDTVARLGSDHFVVLATELDDYGEVERLARQMVADIHKPFVIDGKEIFITASAGVAIIPQDGSETGELLQKSDAARIQVKEEGGNGVAFFEPEMNVRAERRMTVENELRRAQSNNELELYFQPVVDVRRGVVAVTEALLRWTNPKLGVVSPAEFIPVAEDIGLISDIGEWVVKQCQRQLAEWRGLGLEDLRIALNVSALQLRNDAEVSRLLGLLSERDSRGLSIELTESALADSSDRVQQFLCKVRELGCHVALDDFGTGYSSLSYLRHFEFDVLKIDKSFIDELSNNRDYGLVASIVSMGRILGMRVVAEGVETEDQVKRLKQIGCDYIQGYYYSKPLPAADFWTFLHEVELRDVG